jgi:hypothetical protein
MLDETLGNLRTTVHGGVGIGGVRVQLSGKCDADVALVPLLEPFRVQESPFNIEIDVDWVESITRSQGRPKFDSGTTWRLYEGEGGLVFDFQSETLGARPYKRLFIDERFSRGSLRLSEECFAYLPYAATPLGYPLDELLIMHRLTQERAIELHSCGIVRPDGTGNLFVGHSEAGKSTTTRLWTEREDVQILSDDRIIVREDTVRQDKVRKGESRQDRNQIFMYGTPWHGEAHFALPRRAPLEKIFILEHGHGNVLTRLTRSQTVAELFARSFVPFHRHEYVDNALTFLERVADSVPCYHYSFEPDGRAVEKILRFND